MTSEAKKDAPLGRVIVITSGKGGVGKTTSSAAISAGLAKLGFKTVVIDHIFAEHLSQKKSQP